MNLASLSLLALYREGKLATIESTLLESIICRVLDSVEDVTSLPRSLRKVILATKTHQARRLAARMIEEWVIDCSLEPPKVLPGDLSVPCKRRVGTKLIKHGFQVSIQGPHSTDPKLTFYWFGKKHGLGYYMNDIDPPSAVWYKHGVRDGLSICPDDQYDGSVEVSTYVNGSLTKSDKFYAWSEEFGELVGNYSTGGWLRDRIVDVAYSMVE